MITEYKFSGQAVRSQAKSNIADLASCFSNYNSISRDEQEAHAINSYIPKIVSIASHLGVLAENDPSLRDVLALSRLLRTSSKYDDFDPRYQSQYSTKLHEKPDVRSRINQRLIDLEGKLEIEDSPESRFVLLNAAIYLAGKDVDRFRSINLKANSNNLKGLFRELSKDFDTIELDYNANIEAGAAYEAGNEIKAELARKDFEIYLLSELRKKIILRLSKQDSSMEGSKRQIYDILNKKVKKYLSIILRLSKQDSSMEGTKEQIYDILNEKVKKHLSKYSINVSDASVEEFIKMQGNNLVDASLFNNLFNIARRTREDIRIKKNIDFLMYWQNGLHGRNLVFNGNGDERFYDAKDITAKTLEANGDGDCRFHKAENITAKKLEANGDGDERFCMAKNITAEKLEANGDGDERFWMAKNITAETLEANGNGDWRFYNAKNITAEELEANGKGLGRFNNAENFTINGRKFETISDEVI